MEEIFVNPGLQLVLEKICYFLSPKSFQILISTNKFMLAFSANVSEKWFLKCQKAKLIIDVNKWTLLLKIAQEHQIEWNLGLIFKFIYYYRNSAASSIYHEIKEDPFKIVTFLGKTKIVKLFLNENKYKDLMGLIPLNDFPNEGRNYFKECLEIMIKANHHKIETFQAFKHVLKLLLHHDKIGLRRLTEKARNHQSTGIQKILALLSWNSPDLLGNTPMHTLAFRGNIEQNIQVVEFALPLIKYPNPRDDFGTTPMHIAAEHGYLEFVKALIPYWTNKMAKNQEGKTAIEIAEDKGHHEIANLLKPLVPKIMYAEPTFFEKPSGRLESWPNLYQSFSMNQ